MSSANFKPKRTAAASRGFLATARLSCNNYIEHYNVSAQICQICKLIVDTNLNDDDNGDDNDDDDDIIKILVQF